jgi:hypothetical protein
VALRKYGFAHAPLYRASDKYEYMCLPNQDGVRFGNHYHYNSYSQRSDEPDSTKTIVLGLGDSVIYGGVQCDQDDLATSIFTRETGMQMLNISAGSWGPDNCAAYLDENGLFTARAMFLLVSSHDAHDNMTFQPTVGVHKSYPDHQYLLAWSELLDRYILPRFIKPKQQPLDPDQQVLAGTGIRKDGPVFNPGFDRLKAQADSVGIPLLVYLHADQEELSAGAYNDQGEEIMAWCAANDVPLIRELDYHLTTADYRDGIHLSAAGQRRVADIMEEWIKVSDLTTATDAS